MKSLSFDVGRDTGWSAITPLGLVAAERGQHVIIVVSESWDEALEEARRLRQEQKK